MKLQKKNNINLKYCLQWNKNFLFFVILNFIHFSIFSQVRDDFYDPYDFNLRNYKGGENVGKDYDYYKDYSLPPKIKKPFLVNPTNPQLPVDPLLMMPNPGGIRSSNQLQQFQSQSSQQTTKNQNPIINPFTGNVDFNAIQKNQEESKIKKEREKKQKEAFARREPYTETKFRRFEIIFFMTFPFAIALTYIIATIGKFQKTANGTAFVGLGSIALSLLNAYSDKSKVEEFEKNKIPEKHKNEPDYDKDDLSWNNFSKKNYQLYISFGEKSF